MASRKEDAPSSPHARRAAEVTPEEVRRTLDAVKDPALVCSMDELPTRWKAWLREFRGGLRKALAHVDDLRDEPQRGVVLLQAEDELSREMFILDKALGEVISFRPRGARLFNALSLAGVPFVRVDRLSETWLHENASGRGVKSDGRIR
jgi:hypothetical protein